MKFSTLLVSISLITPFYAVHATEDMTDNSNDVTAYCEEQAQMASFEDVNESTQFIQECIESFSLQSGDSQ